MSKRNPIASGVRPKGEQALDSQTYEKIRQAVKELKIAASEAT